MSTKPHRDPSSKSLSKTRNNTPITRLKVVESKGDIFSTPPNTLLIHACNCEGSWGAGIAKAFKSHYPSAYQIYHDHCISHTPEELIGTALLIPTPRGGDDDDDDSTQTRLKSNRKSKTTTAGNKQPSPSEQQHKHQHFIGCLFTSRSKGAKKRDSPSQILDATGSAMRDLLERVAKQEFNSKSTVGEASSSIRSNNDDEDDELKKKEQKVQGGRAVEEIRMCKINSGLFNVPWEETKAVIEGIEVPEVMTESDGKSKAVIREIRCISRE
ncbi:hypothetical protein KC316_g16574 [Hortaea werneckii]|nr:hypothetical protein KC324_g17168 [Hortaea werneckii]KAI7534182.1 hypothetical protein KC316_g16574 [Hortaea werneckii]RMX87527.1 hypothetical protein D0868_14967 [Hortaea werneckii]